MNKKENKYDGRIDRRCWIKSSGLSQDNNGTHLAITQGRHGGLQNAHYSDGSAVIVFKIINNKVEKFTTAYPFNGNPHRENVDYFDDPNQISNFDPIGDFVRNSQKSNYRVATLKDLNPRAPLKVEHPENKAASQNQEREYVSDTKEHTIAHDMCIDCKRSEYDHLIVAVIRPIVISDPNLKPDTSSGFFDTVIFPALRKRWLDRRGEGNITNNDYYVQLTEIIGYDDTQKEPTIPAISQATDWCNNKHNFAPEFIDETKAINKLRSCQTDVRHSRVRFWLPNMDNKKRAMAVSESQLKQFTMYVTGRYDAK